MRIIRIILKNVSNVSGVIVRGPFQILLSITKQISPHWSYTKGIIKLNISFQHDLARSLPYAHLQSLINHIVFARESFIRS